VSFYKLHIFNDRNQYYAAKFFLNLNEVFLDMYTVLWQVFLNLTEVFLNMYNVLWQFFLNLTEVFLNMYTVLWQGFLNLTEVFFTVLLMSFLLIYILYSEVFLNLTEVFLTLTEVFPCFFLSYKANAKLKLAKTGHGPHFSTFVIICVVLLLFVLFYVLFVCKCVLPPCDNPIAVNKYIISF
jgi:hypothetical protein